MAFGFAMPVFPRSWLFVADSKAKYWLMFSSFCKLFEGYVSKQSKTWAMSLAKAYTACCCFVIALTWPSFASMSFGNNGVKYLQWAAVTSSSAGFLGFTMSLRVSLVSLLQASVVSAWYKHRMCSHSFSTLYAAELLVVEW